MSKFNYKKAMERLNEIVSEMESGELDIDKISALVKESSTLLKACKKALTSTEEEINRVIENDGEPSE
ncbi:MAG: exodeoxyribonuclease VII small subunit [Cyclobacteriaceae bacterium]|nr:exodeoxyribonuclease VII small subunit [Cyclobacteriaceae bacterium]